MRAFTISLVRVKIFTRNVSGSSRIRVTRRMNQTSAREEEREGWRGRIEGEQGKEGETDFSPAYA